MPLDRGHRRKRSRSFSPAHNKHKRSWQATGGGGRGNGRPPRRRSPSPLRGGKRNFRPSQSFGSRDYPPLSPLGGPRRSRSRSPRNLKRPLPRSPNLGRDVSPLYPRQSHLPPAAEHDRLGSGLRQRSLSPIPPPKVARDRNKRDSKYSKVSRSPDAHHGRPSMKKKPRHSPSPFSRKRSRSRSGHRSPSSSHKRVDSSSHTRDAPIPQRRVSAPGKKKSSRITLHKRYTLEDQEPFQLEENVTIAILRNPNAEPSEDVTVQRVFDSTVFKMVHKKTEGKKPIFDREEIKVWRHDENLADDPDFERRLVRVKSSTSVTPKPASDSLSRMSPDVIRKAFGLQVGARSRSRSPGIEPRIRLDPRPDPRYESKFRQQLQKEEEMGKKRRGEDTRRGDKEKGGTLDRRLGKGSSRERRRDEDGGRGEGVRGKGETYDLRQALERRRSDREEGGFRIEVRRGEGEPGAELFYRGRSPSIENRRYVQDMEIGRSVVLDHERERNRFSGSLEREVGRRSWDNDRRVGRSRGRGRGGRGKGRRREWSPDRGGIDGGMRLEDVRDRDRSLDRRPRYSNSPPNTRGWRGGGYRGRGGRGRAREFGASYDTEIVSPTQIDDSFKYTQHDDRDISPKPFRGRGSRNRFPSRSFGSNNFRGTNRDGFRGSNRGFRGGHRGKGSFGSAGDRRSIDRVRDISLDREWKHDMYDSLQAEEEQPHSTTVGS